MNVQYCGVASECSARYFTVTQVLLSFTDTNFNCSVHAVGGYSS